MNLFKRPPEAASSETKTVVGRGPIWAPLRFSVRQYILIAAGLLVLAGGVVLLAAAPSTISTNPNVTGTKSLVITNANNDTTVSVAAGTRLVVNLSSLYWPLGSPPAGQTEQSTGNWQSFSTSNTNSLRLVGATTYSLTKSSSNPGAYNGTSKQIYQTWARGASVVEAKSITNPVCGAGITCPRFAVANSYKVTVDITGSSKAPNPGCTPRPGYACPF